MRAYKARLPMLPLPERGELLLSARLQSAPTDRSARACPSRTLRSGERNLQIKTGARGPVPREPSIKMKTWCALTKRAYRRCRYHSARGRRCCYRSARACPSRTLNQDENLPFRGARGPVPRVPLYGKRRIWTSALTPLFAISRR